MKRIFTLLLVFVLLLSFAACGSQKLTMQELVAANQPEKLLETYDSLYIHGTMNGEMYADYYLTDAFSYEKNATWSTYLSDHAIYAYIDGVYERLVYLTKDGIVDCADFRAGQYADVILSQESLTEKIQSVTEEKGQITMTTVMDRKDLVKFTGQENMRTFESVYVLDAKTQAVITQKGVFTLDDGTTAEAFLECAYNEEIPEEIKPFLEYENQTENLRTVTIVFHAGTEKEKTEYVQAPKGLTVGLAQPVDATEGFSLYADAACTVPYQSNGDYTSDVTIYIK